MAQKVHKVNRGDTFFLKVPLYFDGVLEPVAGWTFWFTVKADPENEEDAAAIIQKSSGSGITGLDATSVIVRVGPADTKTKPVGSYYYDIQGKSPAGDIYTLEEGAFVLKPESTRAA